LQGGGVNVGGCTLCGNTERSPSVTISSSTISGNTVANVCTLMFESSHRPHGKLTIACCLQGGGVYVYSGTVTIQTSSSIYGNTANNVRARLQKFPSPRWDTHMFARCLQGGGIRVDGGSVSLIYCQVHSNQASYVRGLMFKSSHHPDGKLTFCSLFAGRRCLGPGWHSGHLIVHHQWEHS
jgi:hypothetical protein